MRADQPGRSPNCRGGAEFPPNASLRISGVKGHDKRLFSVFADFLYDLKRIQSAVKAADWIDPAPLKAVRPELVKLGVWLRVPVK